MIFGCVVGLACYVATVSLICLIELSCIRESLSVIAKASDSAAYALCDEHDWKVEERDNRTIDDLPPYVEKPATKGPTE